MIDFKSSTHDLARETFTLTVRLHGIRKPKAAQTFAEILGGIGMTVQRFVCWDSIGQAFIVAEYIAAGEADEERANGILDFVYSLGYDTGCGIEEVYLASPRGQWLARNGCPVVIAL